jgi:tripartite ATP-independent transporter DctP family solute receptor
MKKLKRRTLSIVVIMAMAVGVGIAEVQGDTLKLAYVAPIGTINHDVAVVFKDEVEKNSGGAIKVNLFPGGQLGNLPQLFGQLKKGAVDLFKTDVVVASIIGGGKSLSVLVAPYLFRDQEHFRKFCDSSMFRELVSEIENKNGIQWVGLLAARTPRAVTTRNKMILTPDDLKGQKIRAPKATFLSKVVRGWGASVAILPAAEIYTSLKQKVVDGQENGIDVVDGFKLYEVQKYYTATDHMRSSEALWMNKSKWDSLSSSQQEIIVKATKAARAWGNKELKEKMLAWFTHCREEGMTIVMPPLKPWVKASQKLIKELDGKEWPEGLYAKIQNVK